MNITSLTVQVKSEGIKETSSALGGLSTSANNAARRIEAFLVAVEKLKAASMSAATSIAQQVQQAAASMNTIQNTLGAAGAASNNLASSTGRASQAMIEQRRQMELYNISGREYARAQAEANRMNRELDASRATRTADIQRRDIEALNVSAKQYAAAQAEAIRMNREFDKSLAGQKLIQQRRDIEASNASAKQYAAAHAEAIRMNRDFDKSLANQRLIQQRRDLEAHNTSAREYARAHAEAIRMNQQFDRSLQNVRGSLLRSNEGMREAHGLVRGLSGSLGALWVTYGALSGMAIGVAIGASLKGVITVGKDVEHTLEMLRVKGGETVESANQMRDAIYSIGQGIYGPQEVVKALEVLVLAGLNAQQAMAALRPALNLATAGGTDIKTAAEGLVTIGTAVGATAENYTMLADGITTAANVSLASVESITNTVKRASVVNKLYGASFEDILIQASALANLGIKDTAAGTAITNFYSDMQGKSEKAQAALKKLGVEFSDANGRAKPLVPMLKDLNDGLNKFDMATQKKLIMDIFGERAKRDVVAITDMIRTAATESGKYGSKLEEIAGKISQMAGVSSLAAAQISLTSENQLKSMGNTLKVVLAKTFTEVSPQLNVFSAKMKEAFNSPQFAAALVSITTAVANFTVALVNNIGPLTMVIAAIAAFKVATMGMAIGTALTGPLMAAATAFGAVTTSASGAAVATGLFGTAIRALPFIGLAAGIATVIGALIMYKFHSTNARNSVIEVAEAYRTNYLEALTTEADQIKKTNDNLAAGLPLMEAQTRAIKEQALEKARLNNLNAVTTAEDDLKKARKGFDDTYGKEYLMFAAKNNKLPPVIVELTKEVEKQKKAMVEFESLNGKKVEQIISGSEKIRQAYLKEQAAAQEAAKKAAGTATAGEGPKKSVLNDLYAAELELQSSTIAAAKKQMTDFDVQQQKLFKAGQIGKLQMIEETGRLQVQKYGEIQLAIENKLKAAKSRGDQSEIQRYLGDAKQATEDLNAARKTNAAATEQAITNYGETYSRLRIQQLEKEGQYGLAAQERFSTEHSATYKQAAADVEYYAKVAKEALAGGDDKGADEALKKVEAAKRAYEQLGETQKAAVEAGFNREAMDAFMTSVTEVKNSFKGVQTAYEGQGLAAMFEAASAASENYRNRIEEIKQRMMGLTDPQMIATATAEMNNAAEAQRKMWVGVGETIGASLESAFGRGGDAMGKLFKVAVDYNNLEKKTGSARIKAYGDAAGAAKNFFKEGSTGYKVLEGAEKAFRALELAGQIQSLVKHLFVTGAKAAATTAGQGVETAAVGAGEAARNLLKIPGVIMSFMSSLGPYGAAAAAVAIAAVLGGAFSGGGGGVDYKERQRTQGTGSVLGDSDAKSESIAKSIEHLEKNSGLGLYHTSEMVKSLKSIQNSMSSLASLIVQSTDLSGKTLATDQGSASKFASSTTGQAVLGGVFGVLADKLTGGWIGKVTGKIANAIFGGKTSNQDVGFTLDKTNLAAALSQGIKAFQYADMKKDGGWFSKDKYYTDKNSLGSEANTQFSSIIGNVANALKEASKMLGVGGDSFTQKLNSFVIDIGKISLKDLSGEEIEKEISAVFSKLGDDMARWALGGFEQFQKVGEGYLETIARVASNLIQVKDVFSVLGQTLDLTGSAAVAVSENLIELAGGIENLTEDTKFYVDNFLTQAERMAPITKSVKDRLAELNLSNLTSIELYKQKIQSLNLMNAADRELYVSLIDLAPAFKEAADYAQDLIDGTVDLTDAQEKALDKVKDARTALQDAYDKEKDSLQGVIDKTKSFIQTLANYKDSLKLGADSPLTNMQKYDEAKLQIESVVQRAVAGDQEAKDKFTSIANSFLAASKVVNASGNAYTADFNYVQNMIDKLSYAAVGEMTTAEASLVALNKQVEGLLEVNKSVLTVAQAIIDLQKALFEGKSKGLTNEQMGVAAGVVIAPPASGGATSQDKMNEILGNVNNNLVMMREELKQQTGAVVGATYSSGAKVSESVDELANIRVKDNIKVQLA